MARTTADRTGLKLSPPGVGRVEIGSMPHETATGPLLNVAIDGDIYA